MLADPVSLLAACIAVILLGISKGGFAGVGAVSTPLLALVVGPVEAAAIVLPILLLQDAVSVWAFRRSWSRAIVTLLLPAATLGVAIAWLFADRLSERWVSLLLGLISVVFAGRSLWLHRGGRVPAPVDPPRWFGLTMGVATGVTSQIAHAGQPPFQMYVLPQRLPRDLLIGTTAVFFAVLNWIKVPAYVALGAFTRAHLLTSLMLAPLAILSTLAGVRLARRVEGAHFYLLVHALMLLIGSRLVWSGVAGG